MKILLIQGLIKEIKDFDSVLMSGYLIGKTKKIEGVVLLIVLISSGTTFIYYQLPHFNSTSSKYTLNFEVANVTRFYKTDNKSLIYEIFVHQFLKPSANNDDWDQNWQLDGVVISLNFFNSVLSPTILRAPSTKHEVTNIGVGDNHLDVSAETNHDANIISWQISFKNTALAHDTHNFKPYVLLQLPYFPCNSNNSSNCFHYQFQYQSTAKFVDYKLLNEYASITHNGTISIF